ncbi:hypothetical protein GCM10009097_24000 [Pigmentiphaga daeguensis]|uniref:Uncharacterized protein n=2 Tax=Alcaligenaceae TaxID=506 RepID=A0ABN1BV91_9BURK
MSCRFRPPSFVVPVTPVASQAGRLSIYATEANMATQEKVTGPASYFPSIEKKHGELPTPAMAKPGWAADAGPLAARHNKASIPPIARP